MTWKERHFFAIAELPCAACGARPVAIHHITCVTPRRDWAVIPLCAEHHQFGKVSIHRSKKTFEATYGSEETLLTETVAKLSEQGELDEAFCLQYNEYINGTYGGDDAS